MSLTKAELNTLMALGTKKCLVCFEQSGKIRNDTLYWHEDSESKGKGVGIWTWCNRCERGYSIEEYCAKAGLSLSEFLKQDFNIKESKPNEVQKIEWPRAFIPLFDDRASKGVEYLESRGIAPDDNLFYDMGREGIVFPYYFDQVFCGAQVRLIKPWTYKDGVERKIDTVPGTRVGLLFYNWNQQNLPSHIKGIIITEGAFNALSIQQALNTTYGGFLKNPFKCVALSGSGVSMHHLEQLGELKLQGYKIICAPDYDDAGHKMMKKFVDSGVATHSCLTEDAKKDWNDIAQTMSSEEFARWFIGRIKRVQS